MGFSDHSYSIFRRQFGYADSRRNKPLFRQNNIQNRREEKSDDDELRDDYDLFNEPETNDDELQ